MADSACHSTGKAIGGKHDRPTQSNGRSQCLDMGEQGQKQGVYLLTNWAFRISRQTHSDRDAESEVTLAEKMLQNFQAEPMMAIACGNDKRIAWLKKHIEMLKIEIEGEK